MSNDIENHMVLPQAESVAKPDEDEAYEILRQQEIDDAAYLNNVLRDITLTLGKLSRCALTRDQAG